ncbi:hypothetical protein GOBAR_AA03157 [Gossypium barbadense]|uniref:Uncharacterized protein n=1 Tax=Gossypium barbadense TaxID=3634 RepID=A0A2P5YP91_GOSBA|nr:hypothetical protein GOBAR_AA03157 [Gossypium barbadense]
MTTSSLPSNTESNPREKLNAINVQNEKGVIEPEPEPRQETVEKSLKEAHESFSNNNRGPTHEERRLHIEELDEWRTHKPRTHDKLKLRQNELDTFPNQLKVGDKLLLDATDPYILTTRPDEETLLTVYNVIFMRKEGRCRYFKEEEGSVIFCGSNRENSYLHAILAHTITGRRESIGVVNTHDAYFLWCMSHRHVIDLAYFVALAIQHQMEWHRKGVISIGPYEEAYEDIPDDIPSQHEDPPTQPPPPSRPVHATASYADISERLT